MFNPIKILFLLLVGAGIWYGYRWIKGVGAVRPDGAVRDGRSGNTAGRAQHEIEDMVRCPVCDTFIPADNPKDCGRPDCPAGR